MATDRSTSLESQAARERNLRGSFANLSRNHGHIRQLFRSVASHLAVAIKTDHRLCKEWDELAERHHERFRDSQVNASECADFLTNHQAVLVPLSTGDMSLEEKQTMICTVLGMIPAHQAKARMISDDFHALAREVERFMIKISKAAEGGICWRLLKSTGWLCKSAWEVLKESIIAIANAMNAIVSEIFETMKTLLFAMTDAFNAMLSRISGVRLYYWTPGRSITLWVELKELDSYTSRSKLDYVRLASESPLSGSQSCVDSAKQDCAEIVDTLGAFEGAWHRLHLACTSLLTSLVFASNLSTIPVACEANLQNAENIYRPLITCLREYADGGFPL